MVDRGPSSDHGQLQTLVEKALSVVRLREQLADAGYDSERNHEFCHTHGIESIIPAKIGHPGPARGPHRRRMQEAFPSWRYAHRSKATETVFSVIKRKSGPVLRSRQEALKRKEALLKTVVYNLHRDVVRVNMASLHQVN